MIINAELNMQFENTLCESGYLDGLSLKPFTGKAYEISADYCSMYALGLEKALGVSISGVITRKQ